MKRCAGTPPLWTVLVAAAAWAPSPHAIAVVRPRASSSRCTAPRQPVSLRRTPVVRAKVRAGADVLSTGMQSLASAFEHELAVAPLQTNALVTGVTFFLGDFAAQAFERMRGERHSDGARADAHVADRGGLSRALRGVSTGRLVRSFAAGCMFLGPLTHFYYEWVAAHDTLDVPAKVLLDNTLFLFLDNSCYVLSLTLLGGGTHALAGTSMPGDDIVELLADTLGSVADELWSMQLTGWRILPAVAIFNYLFVPNGHRVIFMDGVDVVFAALLSLQHAHAVEAHDDSEPAQSSRH